ncbi:MAG: DUF1311 domain-containing protein [Rhodocyclales bacterium]|nr:DUF1311 domain-containing protein [Rhodocyclales bacterium]
MTRLALFVVLCVLSVQAHSTTDVLLDPPIFGHCATHKELCAVQCKGGGSIFGPGPCLTEQYAVAEQVLNESYKRLVELSRTFDEDLPQKLVQAQRAWLKFRKFNCEYHHGKTLTNDSFDYGDCMLRITRQRALELKKLVKELER